jgi:hypothetical protein
MLLSRFDRARLRPVEPAEVTARSCAGTRAIVQACQLGAGPATRPLGQPWVPPRIEWPFGVFHVADTEAARRACLQLDGTWAMVDAAGGLARLRIRAAALAADAAWWRPLTAGDAWDAGVARSVAGLQGFKPRRATLIVVEQALLSRDELSVLAHLEQQAFSWPRAVRVVLVGGHPPALARPLAA